MAQSLEYIYTKTRKNFGRQPMFSVQEKMIDSIMPDKLEQNKYCLRNPVNKESQIGPVQTEHCINTTRVIHENQGLNHAEGGWPREINHTDEEATTRHRRRVERDETYIDAVLGTYNRLNKCIKQNNAIEMYDMFFKSMEPVQPVEKTTIRLVNMYRDKGQRRIGSLCWTHEDDSKLVVTYCDKRYPIRGPVNQELSCSIWSLDNPNEPTETFIPPCACWQAVCSPANPSLLIGGLEDGRVCLFDVRAQKHHVALSPAHLAHREPISALVYMQSRLNLEFFSGSTDGSCIWWDVRNLSENTDYLIMSVRARPGENATLANAEPVTALQFDKAFPTNFLCGTDTGLVISVNRKGKSPKEMMSSVFEAQLGPVKVVQRSPGIMKMFLTCGDWAVHIWSEDISISPIITGTRSRYSINDAAWSPQRLSAYMTVSADGIFRFWDLLRSYRQPSKSLLISKVPLLKMEPHQDGRTVAVGDTKGIVYSLSLSQNMSVSADTDKNHMVQLYDREYRREHILEARVKEIRLKQATAEKAVGENKEVLDEDAVLRSAEEGFRRIVADEVRRTGYVLQTGPTRKTPTKKNART